MKNRDQLFVGSIWNRKKEPECCIVCPTLSQDVNNILECREDGLYATAESGVGNAANGLSVIDNDVVLGQSVGDALAPATLLNSREIPMGNNHIYWTGTNGRHSFGYANTSTAPSTTVDINGQLAVSSNLGIPNYGLASGAPGQAFIVHSGFNWGLIITRPDVNQNAGQISFFKTYSGNASVKAAAPVGTFMGRINFMAVSSDNVTTGLGSSMFSRIYSNTAPFVRGYLVFTNTNAAGGQSDELLVLSADGELNLGLSGFLVNGQSADQSKLRVNQTLTGTQDFSGFYLTSTWNTTGTPTAIKLNVTDTASNASSLLMDLQVASTSVFKIGKTIPEYADNTAATSAGLTVGTIYRTADVLKIVHA